MATWGAYFKFNAKKDAPAPKLAGVTNQLIASVESSKAIADDTQEAPQRGTSPVVSESEPEIVPIDVTNRPLDSTLAEVMLVEESAVEKVGDAAAAQPGRFAKLFGYGKAVPAPVEGDKVEVPATKISVPAATIPPPRFSQLVGKSTLADPQITPPSLVIEPLIITEPSTPIESATVPVAAAITEPTKGGLFSKILGKTTTATAEIAADAPSSASEPTRTTEPLKDSESTQIPVPPSLQERIKRAAVMAVAQAARPSPVPVPSSTLSTTTTPVLSSVVKEPVLAVEPVSIAISPAPVQSPTAVLQQTSTPSSRSVANVVTYGVGARQNAKPDLSYLYETEPPEVVSTKLTVLPIIPQTSTTPRTPGHKATMSLDALMMDLSGPAPAAPRRSATFAGNLVKTPFNDAISIEERSSVPAPVRIEPRALPSVPGSRKSGHTAMSSLDNLMGDLEASMKPAPAPAVTQAPPFLKVRTNSLNRISGIPPSTRVSSEVDSAISMSRFSQEVEKKEKAATAPAEAMSPATVQSPILVAIKRLSQEVKNVVPAVFIASPVQDNVVPALPAVQALPFQTPQISNKPIRPSSQTFSAQSSSYQTLPMQSQALNAKTAALQILSRRLSIKPKPPTTEADEEDHFVESQIWEFKRQTEIFRAESLAMEMERQRMLEEEAQFARDAIRFSEEEEQMKLFLADVEAARKEERLEEERRERERIENERLEAERLAKEAEEKALRETRAMEAKERLRLEEEKEQKAREEERAQIQRTFKAKEERRIAEEEAILKAKDDDRLEAENRAKAFRAKEEQKIKDEAEAKERGRLAEIAAQEKARQESIADQEREIKKREEEWRRTKIPMGEDEGEDGGFPDLESEYEDESVYDDDATTARDTTYGGFAVNPRDYAVELEETKNIQRLQDERIAREEVIRLKKEEEDEKEQARMEYEENERRVREEEEVDRQRFEEERVAREVQEEKAARLRAKQEEEEKKRGAERAAEQRRRDAQAEIERVQREDEEYERQKEEEEEQQRLEQDRRAAEEEEERQNKLAMERAEQEARAIAAEREFYAQQQAQQQGRDEEYDSDDGPLTKEQEIAKAEKKIQNAFANMAQEKLNGGPPAVQPKVFPGAPPAQVGRSNTTAGSVPRPSIRGGPMPVQRGNTIAGNGRMAIGLPSGPRGGKVGLPGGPKPRPPRN